MSDRPNLLLVCTDHWPGRLFGHRGRDDILTPTFDELARCGTVFTRAYSECPVCIPARRTLMTGTTPATHGDRVYSDRMTMPELPTLAGCFRDAGYQAQAIGKLHVYPQRDRIGFDDCLISEEGRMQFGVQDDYESWLVEQGFPGEYFGHGMGNNQYHVAPWHLPEHTHVTNWATRTCCKAIKRRDPTRPGFWYLGYVHPHPPLVPPASYLELYRDWADPGAAAGDWSAEAAALPPALWARRQHFDQVMQPTVAALARRAFRALCTHIDHQLRLVIGTLREEGLLQNTIICLLADHGDMLGDHGIWGKRLFYEPSSNVPCILTGGGCDRLRHGVEDDRLVGLQDIMPTLLDAAGIAVPESVEGRSLLTDDRRDELFGEIGEGGETTRMLHDGRYKLIWYAAGNVLQLFDIVDDPDERVDLSASPEHRPIRDRLSRRLVHYLHDGDEGYVDQDGQLVGTPAPESVPAMAQVGLAGQRGIHHPPPGW